MTEDQEKAYEVEYKEWHDEFTCKCCGVNTYDIDEYYMVKKVIWKLVAGVVNGMLCIGCFESSIGRKLTPNDFTSCPLNEGFSHMQSERLLDRLGDMAYRLL